MRTHTPLRRRHLAGALLSCAPFLFPYAGADMGAESAAAAGRAPARPDAVIPEVDFAPQNELVVSSPDVANWVLSYPMVQPLVPPAGAAWAREASEAATRGALAEAVFSLDALPAEHRDLDWHLYRGNLLLRIGMLEEAAGDLRAALKLAPDEPRALALASVIASASGKVDTAEETARRATRLAPASGPAWLALSYTQQARGDLDGALASTCRAQEADTRHGAAWIRDAELHLARGRTGDAKASANHALALQPDSAIAHSMTALVALLEGDDNRARAGFEQAVTLAPTDANARFGLALAHIRQGNLSQARDELEIAVGRAPNNSLFLAYLGRVRLAMGEEDQARALFDQARKLDPRNPDPWLFGGMAHLLDNRPASALMDFREAGDRIAGRRVYRGSKLLSQDEALNHIDQSRALEALGFREPAMEQARLAAEDQCCGAALRQLADAYALFPRGIQARRSLALMSLFDARPGQLPLLLDAVPGVGSAAAGVPSHTLPQGLEPRPSGLNEYSSLFANDGWRLAVDSHVGGFDTWDEQVRVGGRAGGLGLGFAQRFLQSEGPDGRATDNRNWQLLMHGELSQGVSAFLEYRNSTSHHEEVFFPYDPFLVLPMEVDDRIRVARLGSSVQTGANGQLNLLFSRQWRQQNVDNPATESPGRADMPEIQYRHRWDRFSLILGASRFHDRGDYDFVGGPSFPNEALATSLYGYGSWRPGQDWLMTLGLSHVDFSQDGGTIEYTRSMPKLGVRWSPFSGASLRFAALESAALPKTGGAGLEPLEVAGTQQWFGDEIGTIVRRLKLSWEQRLTSSLTIAMETSHDRLSVPGALVLDRQYERGSKAGLYWQLPLDSLSAWEGGLRLTYDRVEQNRPNIITDNNNIRRQLAQHWSLGANLAGPHGLGFQAALTRVEAAQRIEPFTIPLFEDGQHFWITDLALSRTFSRGRGQFSFGVRNATDRDLGRYQEIDPLLPRFSPQRFTYARLQWRFD